MEVDSGILKTDYQTFLDILSKFDEVRVAVAGGDPPFENVFLKAEIQDVIKTVENYKMDVQYSIMYNSRVNPDMSDNLYIHAMKITII